MDIFNKKHLRGDNNPTLYIKVRYVGMVHSLKFKIRSNETMSTKEYL